MARFFLVPFNIGFHLAHHVDAGVSFRNLPKYHQMLVDSSYINVPGNDKDGSGKVPGNGRVYQYPNYRSLWSAPYFSYLRSANYLVILVWNYSL